MSAKGSLLPAMCGWSSARISLKNRREKCITIIFHRLGAFAEMGDLPVLSLVLSIRCGTASTALAIALTIFVTRVRGEENVHAIASENGQQRQRVQSQETRPAGLPPFLKERSIAAWLKTTHPMDIFLSAQR